MTVGAGTSVGEVRQAIPSDKINAYIAQNVPEIAGPVQIKQFNNGQSNPTYLLEDTKGAKFVLRKKPPGQLLSQTAHNVEREYTILSALQKYNATTTPENVVPAPPVYAFSKDLEVVGSPFYIMKFIKGRIFTDNRLEELPKEERAQYHHEMVKTISRLARVNPKDLNLPASFAPPVNYFDRQIKSIGKLARVYAAVPGIGLMPGFEELEEYLRQTNPKQANVNGIVHGDFKLDNVIFHPTEPRVIGILDWELCTIGAPVMDLICSTSAYVSPSYPHHPESEEGMFGLLGMDPHEIGLPRWEELAKTWCEGSGTPYPINYLQWAAGLQFWRSSVMTQGIAVRHALGQASGVGDSARIWGEARFRTLAIAKRLLTQDAIAKVLAKASTSHL